MPTVRSSKTSSTASGGALTFTPTLPTTITANDVLCLVLVVDRNAGVDIPTNWNACEWFVTGVGSSGIRTNIYWKLATGSDTAPVFTFSESSRVNALVLSLYDIDLTTPFRVAAQGSTSTTTSIVTPTLSIPSTTLAYFLFSVRTNVSNVNTSATGMTELFDFGPGSSLKTAVTSASVTAGTIPSYTATSTTANYTMGVVIAFTPPSSPNGILRRRSWRWYDSSGIALAAENANFTMSGVDQVLSLRVQLQESTANVRSGTIQLQYSGDQNYWLDLPPTAYDANLVHRHVRWGDGSGIDGANLAASVLAGSTQSGTILESTQSVSIQASSIMEYDIHVRIAWPAPDSTVYLRILWNGLVLGTTTNSVIALTTCSAANRPNTIGVIASHPSLAPATELRFSQFPRVVHDGTFWYLLYVDPTLTTGTVYRWSGSGAWTRLTDIPLTGSYDGGRLVPALKVINGVPVVWLAMYDSSLAFQAMRGTISAGTITWGSQLTTTFPKPDRNHSATFDEANYIWFGGIDTTIPGVWAGHSTNPDTGTAWTSGWATRYMLSDSGVAASNVVALYAIASDKVLMVWRNGNALKWATCQRGVGWSAIQTLAATAQALDWGGARSGQYLYLVHTNSIGSGGSGTWVLKVYDLVAGAWADGPASGISNQGVGTRGIVVTTHQDTVYVFGVFLVAGNDHVIKYATYTGPGTSGTWSSLTQLSPAGRGKVDFLTGAVQSHQGKVLCVAQQGDDDMPGTPFAAEYYTISLVQYLTYILTSSLSGMVQPRKTPHITKHLAASSILVRLAAIWYVLAQFVSMASVRLRDVAHGLSTIQGRIVRRLHASTHGVQRTSTLVAQNTKHGGATRFTSLVLASLMQRLVACVALYVQEIPNSVYAHAMHMVAWGVSSGVDWTHALQHHIGVALVPLRMVQRASTHDHVLTQELTWSMLRRIMGMRALAVLATCMRGVSYVRVVSTTLVTFAWRIFHLFASWRNTQSAQPTLFRDSMRALIVHATLSLYGVISRVCVKSFSVLAFFSIRRAHRVVQVVQVVLGSANQWFRTIQNQFRTSSEPVPTRYHVGTTTKTAALVQSVQNQRVLAKSLYTFGFFLITVWRTIHSRLPRVLSSFLHRAHAMASIRGGVLSLPARLSHGTERALEVTTILASMGVRALSVGVAVLASLVSVGQHARVVATFRLACVASHARSFLQVHRGMYAVQAHGIRMVRYFAFSIATMLARFSEMQRTLARGQQVTLASGVVSAHFLARVQIVVQAIRAVLWKQLPVFLASLVFAEVPQLRIALAKRFPIVLRLVGVRYHASMRTIQTYFTLVISRRVTLQRVFVALLMMGHAHIQRIVTYIITAWQAHAFLLHRALQIFQRAVQPTTMWFHFDTTLQRLSHSFVLIHRHAVINRIVQEWIGIRVLLRQGILDRYSVHQGMQSLQAFPVARSLKNTLVQHALTRVVRWISLGKNNA